MLIALGIIGSVLLLLGIAACLLNFAIVLRSLRTDEHASMVPFVGSFFILFGIALLGRGGWLAQAFSTIAIPFLFLDLSGLPSLLMLPFYLLLRAIRGADAPPLLPSAAWRVIIMIYGAIVGVLSLCCLFRAAQSA